MERPKHRIENEGKHVENERDLIEVEEDEVTLSSEDSFPASDPPSFNPGVTGAKDVKKKKPARQH